MSGSHYPNGGADEVSQAVSYADEWDRHPTAYGMGQLRAMAPVRPGECVRKKRLALVAAARSVWDHLTLPSSRRAVEAAERYADDPGWPEIERHYLAARRSAERVAPGYEAYLRWSERAANGSRLRGSKRKRPRLADSPKAVLARVAARIARPQDLKDDSDVPEWIDILHTLQAVWPRLAIGSEAEADAHHARLLRDVFPNPFRPVTFGPNWRTETAVRLARGMYESRAFSAMPILADALQDAGCDHPDVLAHCRDDQLHVRGCWVVDLIMGKS